MVLLGLGCDGGNGVDLHPPTSFSTLPSGETSPPESTGAAHVWVPFPGNPCQEVGLRARCDIKTVDPVTKVTTLILQDVEVVGLKSHHIAFELPRGAVLPTEAGLRVEVTKVGQTYPPECAGMVLYERIP